MLDRCSRRYVIEHVNHVSQDEVIKAIGKMKARKALPVIRSVTTDNGCEFLDQKSSTGRSGPRPTTRGHSPTTRKTQ